MLIGYFIVKAEPAVQVLNKQVADMTGGTISETAMMKGLSIGMALSLGFSLFRVLTGLPLLKHAPSGLRHCPFTVLHRPSGLHVHCL